MSDSSTADVGPVESGVRKLSELRVIDLKAELKRRNLDISGNKGLLSERLKKASGTPDINISNHLATLCCKNMLCMHKSLGWMFTAGTLTYMCCLQAVRAFFSFSFLLIGCIGLLLVICQMPYAFITFSVTHNLLQTSN